MSVKPSHSDSSGSDGSRNRTTVCETSMSAWVYMARCMQFMSAKWMNNSLCIRWYTGLPSLVIDSYPASDFFFSGHVCALVTMSLGEWLWLVALCVLSEEFLLLHSLIVQSSSNVWRNIGHNTFNPCLSCDKCAFSHWLILNSWFELTVSSRIGAQRL